MVKAGICSLPGLNYVRSPAPLLFLFIGDADQDISYSHIVVRHVVNFTRPHGANISRERRSVLLFLLACITTATRYEAEALVLPLLIIVAEGTTGNCQPVCEEAEQRTTDYQDYPGLLLIVSSSKKLCR